MKFWYVKLSCPSSRDNKKFLDIMLSIKNKQILIQQELTNIPNNLKIAKVGDLLFLHMGGDANNKRNYFDDEDLKDFENGIHAIAKIESLNHEDSSLTINMYPISEPVSKMDLYFYPQFADNLGCLTKGTPNQAGLYELTLEQGYGFLDYLRINNILGNATNLIGESDYKDYLLKGFERFVRRHPGFWSKKSNSLLRSVFSPQIKKNSSLQKGQCKTLPKPFLLLAGISGTGKSRFVREQAKQSSGEEDPSNYALISVRPDWHEPSDLLGYVSRLGDDAPHFVSTPTLKFMVQAWKAINPSPDELNANRFTDKSVLPYWLCLDEMNLAPVEQYFADYLSVIETREWTEEGYRCAPLLKSDVIKGLSDKGKEALQKDLGLEKDFDTLWDYFCEKGIPLPYNLIVAGTVNMDETTHGFSRKVIDRALSIDFGEFFPNKFDSFFNDEQSINPILLGYPTASEAREKTQEAEQSRQFLSTLNGNALKGTAFEVAFRALNELLLSVQSFSPYEKNSPAKLQAVWDDFLMMKVLPRIEGDRDKVGEVLEKLNVILTERLNHIWSDEAKRPDLWRETEEMIVCRSKAKIKWMQDRLDQSGFTSFWP